MQAIWWGLGGACPRLAFRSNVERRSMLTLPTTRPCGRDPAEIRPHCHDGERAARYFRRNPGPAANNQSAH